MSIKKSTPQPELLTLPNDLLIFPLTDGHVAAMIVAEIIGQRNRHYRFVPVIGRWQASPSLMEIVQKNLAAVKIDSTMGLQRTMTVQPGVEVFWQADERVGFFIGLAEFTCKEKDWKNMRPQMEKIGEIRIKPAFNTMAALQYLESFEGLQNIYSDIAAYIQNYGWQSYPVSSLCEI